jgi:hypothetical protein
MSISILDVNGTTIVFNETNFASNGSVSDSQLLTIDISVGSLSNSSFLLGSSTPFFVAAGLAVGDPFYSGLTAKINETFTREFAGANRVCDFFTGQPPDNSVLEWGYYWDQATGLMVRQFKTIFTSNPFGILKYETELVATSLWSPGNGVLSPDLSIPILFGASFVVFLGVAAVFVFRSRRNQTERPVRPEEAEEETEMVPARQVRRCVRCGAILAENASYCLRCGEPIGGVQLPKGPKSALEPIRRARSNASLIGQRCMVCDLPVKRGEELVRCPHCNNIAHKTHMLEWLHVRGTCPVCGEHIEDSSLGTL